MRNRRPSHAGIVDTNNSKGSGAAFTGLRLSLVEEQISCWTQRARKGEVMPQVFAGQTMGGHNESSGDGPAADIVVADTETNDDQVGM